MHSKEAVFPGEDKLDYAGDRGGPVQITNKMADRRRKCCKTFLELFLLPTLLAIAMVLGVGIGFIIRSVDPQFTQDKRRIMYLNYPGELLLRMLKCIILPLIFTSLVAGIAALPFKAAGKLGGRTVAYYLLTTFLAVLLGILLVCTIKPGDRGRISQKSDRDKLVDPIDALLDLVRNVFPPNIVQATISQTKTVYPKVLEQQTLWNATLNVSYSIPVMVDDTSAPSLAMGGGSNILGIVMFSILLGLMIGRMGEAAKPLTNIFDLLQKAIIKIVYIIIWYSPFGIVFLLAARIVGMDDPGERFKELAWYMMTVIVGLIIHAFIILPTIYVIFARRNPFKLMGHMSHALLNALGTASSAATLPITMDNLERNAKVNPLVSRFMLPVGATINMDGTALYEAVAAIFIAQYNDISLSAGQIVTVSITATAAAIGAAGVPEAGLVTMIIVLTAVGLPIEDVGLIYAVDWFLDRCRTAVNVWGDSIGAATIEATVKEDLKYLDEDKTGNDVFIVNGEPAISHL